MAELGETDSKKAAVSSEKGKKVTFAPDVKSASASSTSTPSATPVPEIAKKADEEVKKDETKRLDGVIGRLEIYQSGAVKMRLENGILLDVSSCLWHHCPLRLIFIT